MHHPNFQFVNRISKVKNELYEVYLNQIIKEFAVSLIGVFVPIYLLTVGFSLDWAIIYMGIYLFSIGALSPLAAFISPKIGLKNTIILSMPVVILFYSILLFFLGHNPYMLVLAAAIHGLSAALHAIPINSVFIKHADKVHSGEQVSHLMAFPQIATLFAPLIGGFILIGAGFTDIFSLVIGLLVISSLPLILTKDEKKGFDFGIRKFNPLVHKHFSATFFFQGGSFIVAELMWPLFIYMQSPNFAIVGISSTISGFGVSLVLLLLGKITKDTNTLKLVKLGGIGYAATWFSRIFASGPIEIMAISFLSGCFSAVISVPMFAGFCSRFRERNILGSVVFRETWLTAGRVFAIAVILLFAGNKFEFSFILAGIMSLLFLVVK